VSNLYFVSWFGNSVSRFLLPTRRLNGFGVVHRDLSGGFWTWNTTLYYSSSALTEEAPHNLVIFTKNDELYSVYVPMSSISQLRHLLEPLHSSSSAPQNTICPQCLCAFSALTLLVVHQEEHLACKNWVMRCWCSYLSAARCRLHVVQLMSMHPKTAPSLASFKSRLVLPFWYRLTQIVQEKRPLNGYSSSSSSYVEKCSSTQKQLWLDYFAHSFSECLNTEGGQKKLRKSAPEIVLWCLALSLENKSWWQAGEKYLHCACMYIVHTHSCT